MTIARRDFAKSNGITRRNQSGSNGKTQKT